MDVLLKQFLNPAMYNIWMNIVVLSLAGFYLLLTAPKPLLISWGAPATSGQRVSFMIGLCLFYLALGSPVNLIGRQLFSVHMLQQSILYLIMPSFLLLGIPRQLYRLGFSRIRGAVRAFSSLWSRPLIALVTFNGLFSLYHVPRIFDGIMGNEWYHALSHGLLILAALMMWWPVMEPLPEQAVLSPLRKLAYICAAGVLLTPACALIIFADHQLFQSYMGEDRLFPVLSVMDDQQMGGVIMKILQEITYGFTLGHVFFKWVRTERKKEKNMIGNEKGITLKESGSPQQDWLPSLEGKGSGKNMG
ncbi:cytochrome C oxidase assembly protein [Kroppenstedtia pulmonis]|uniref:Cytochrome C oxidase assembly protein n=1 Tax=Kroppenstedtia pulmonis TaxID=1380685 RepID=A0A7D3Y8A4_9BACL|nr:cytochrome c oxidase assembly protein [Kroppenstedtia pulmonis]QKG83441.1 cytochrome C oxidase assembly protein [Kroppenstedtia pulmonis]